MQRVTVTFDLVFNLQRVPGSLLSTRRTIFSFIAGGVTQRDLTVQGWPKLQVGDTVTALLRRKDDWHTLVGWVNHETGEIAAPSPQRTLRRALLLTVAVGLLVTLVYALLAINTPRMAPLFKSNLWLLWAGYGVFLLLLGAAVLVRRWRHRRAAHHLELCYLELTSGQPPRSDAGAPASAKAATDAGHDGFPDTVKHD